MRAHTSLFKENIALLGRQQNVIITYQQNGETITLGMEDLNSVSPHFEGGILKSVMKQLDIDSNVEIPEKTTLNLSYGIKTSDLGNIIEYEYLNLGNYIVYKTEKQEDTKSYKITCYDKMLYAMTPYENMGITYPITIRDYLNSICTYLGISFASASDTFANYDKVIQNELYLDAEGNDLGYTFRDVLDELSQVTASTICINDVDELEVRYITDTGDTIDAEYLKDTNVNFGEKYGKVNSIVLSRSAESDNIYLRDEESVAENGLCEIKIVDNQIMNFNDRFTYLEDILEKLDGLEYNLNDFSSTGIVYYELCDRYSIQIGNETYSCVLFNDEVNISQGLEELIHTDMPEESETDYTKSDKMDRKINQAYVIVDKQNQKIDSFVEQVQTTQELNENRIIQISESIQSVQETITSTEETISIIQQELINGQGNLQNTLVTININGIDVSTNTSAISTLISNEKFVIKSGDKILAYFGYDEELGATKSEIDNITIKEYLVTGYHRIQKWTSPDDEERTGFFWIGG